MSTTANQAPASARTVLILGGGDVGSAVAHLLFRAGLRVLICDRPASPHARRGMAFTDALFDGTATLEGVQALRQAGMAGVQACWLSGAGIPVVTLPESELLAAHRFDVVVDATMKRSGEPPDLRALAGWAIGLGPGYCPGRNCNVAIETQWGESMGRILRDAPAAPRSGGPRALDGVTRERFGIAPCDGVWRTSARLGQMISRGDPVGELAEHIVRAPIAGHLRGLTRDGVLVQAGQRLLEVDPRSRPQVTGLGERPVAIAEGVAVALQCAPARPAVCS